MTTRVPRHCTIKRATRTSPWSKRTIWPTGAPRVCLTNLRTPFVVQLGEETSIVLGQFDQLLRLYQHRGLTRASVLRDDKVCYRLDDEWERLKEMRAEWLEFVDDQQETVLRIDFQSALRYGSEEPTPRGPVWAVPIWLYTKQGA